METSKYAIEQLSKSSDIILVQEHWYFDCQLDRLGMVSSKLTGTGKAVDTGDPILPAQMPRGYGGVGILWKNTIDHLVTSTQEGANRIQCVELQLDEPILVISVYLPCKGLRENVEEFEDCLAQLFEITQKYRSTHHIVLGGDFNEDITAEKDSKRLRALNQFLNDTDLITDDTSKTYTGPTGIEISTIDYIFYSMGIERQILSLKVLDDLDINVSDHHPVCCETNIPLAAVITHGTTLPPSKRVRWDKVDRPHYQQAISSAVTCLDTNVNSLGALDERICKLNQILVSASSAAGPTAVRRVRKAKLKTWTPEIQEAVKDKKEAFKQWKNGNRPEESSNPLVISKKLTTIHLRRLCRIESARSREQSRQELLDARAGDKKTFYKLVDKQRGKLKHCVNELSVEGCTYKSENEILHAWREHFGGLATPANHKDFDEKYKRQVEAEMLEIMDMCSPPFDQTPKMIVSEQQVKEAIEGINRGKAADFHGVTIEHFLHGGQDLLKVTTAIVNQIFRLGRVTEALKIGTLTPVYKNKGSSTDAKNYRGITILPTFTKIIETLLRDHIQPLIEDQQNRLQRGFTRNSSPMNCSLILEETIREYKDLRKPLYVAFLDAKSAFDVVSHESLLRKLFHAGVDGVTWSLIHSLHQDAESVVKWNGAYSDAFKISQGVRQGGILSTDLYKLYGNDMLNRLEKPCLGCHIGEISCVAPACADDVTIGADKKSALQQLVNVGVDFSGMERFLLQPVKSVILEILDHVGGSEHEDLQISMNGVPMPVVKEVMHMGIMRSSDTQETAVRENIQKARRTIYSLMGSGLHGHNGLDPETSLHLLSIYVLPVLVYGLEVVLPKNSLVEKLERTYKQFIKHILSLPTIVADPAVYVLSGVVPIEAVIHKRALTLFGNICRLDDGSIERQLAQRQFAVKGCDSSSWFVAVKRLLVKYDLPDCWDVLENRPTKYRWKSLVNRQVNTFWADRIRSRATLYSSLQYLAAGDYYPGKTHWVLQHTGITRDIPCVGIKLKLLTGTYILQSNRAAFNQNQVDPTCLMCQQEPETVDHFLVGCSALEDKRCMIMDSIIRSLADFTELPMTADQLVQIILDCSKVIDRSSRKCIEQPVRDFEIKLVKIPQELTESEPKAYPKHQRERWTNTFSQTIKLQVTSRVSSPFPKQVPTQLTDSPSVLYTPYRKI